eukprot:NODE_5263_length_597_cov_258.691882.p3 GENE.NODE_5263_length_597_cov_258.691882~~NODE_5263_length_597_cov_258.691882.p3  ORF type:complete len:79 (-),score=25.71 NODE_5263_length_597_cov_258.691882:249-485(-)
MPESVTRDDLEWMSQWDPEEELVAEYANFEDSPWYSASLLHGAAARGMAAIAAVAVISGMAQRGVDSKASAGARSHIV